MAPPDKSIEIEDTINDETAQLIRSNNRLSQLIKKFDTNLRKTGRDRISKGYLQARITLLNEYWKTFESTHHQIMDLIDEEDEQNIQYCVQNTYGTVEDYYLKSVTFVNEKMDDLCPSAPTIAPPVNQQERAIPTEPRIKLPAVTIPKFDGTYQSWPAFHDLFKSLVHDNSTIAPVHKLHYLKSNLTGEAEQLLRHFQVTTLNYGPAWEMLIQRYENKRILINSTLKTLFNQPRMNQESSNGIKKLLDTTIECLHSLTNLGIDTTTESMDVIVNYLVAERLTTETHLLWEQSLENSRDIPKFSELKDFLESRFRALEIVASKPQHKNNSSRNPTGSRQTQAYFGSSNTAESCILCSQNHQFRKCGDFKRMTESDRIKYVASKRLCSNCLSTNHLCAKCPSKFRCFVCKKRHHTLLHTSSSNPQRTEVVASAESPSSSSSASSSSSSSSSPSNSPSSSAVNSFHANNVWQSGNVLLATAIIRVTTEAGREYLLRALLDQGSQSSFITESASQLLGLKKHRVSTTISGIGEGQTTSNSQVQFYINAHFQQKLQLPVNALVLRSLTRLLPSNTVNIKEWEHVTGLILADPEFSQSAKIDVVLGADAFAEIILEGVRKGPAGTPVAQKTKLGWILSGTSSSLSSTATYSVSLCSNVQLDDNLKKFWELENENTKRAMTEEEQYCETFFEKNFFRNLDGRCVVKLPFKRDFTNTTLGRSKQIAVQRFNHLERSFNVKPAFAEKYSSCLQEYLTLNHMELIPQHEESLVVHDTGNKPIGIRGCYLPHHGVVKESSTTTKLRVVFDASQATSSGASLNDTLLTGPRIQDDLISILTRWRKHRIAFTADIEKMYRQVLVTKGDAEFQRILWRDNPNNPLQGYRLLTLTFGTSAAPYLAIKSIQHLARLEQSKYPLAAQAIINNFYVDDLLAGADGISEATKIQVQLSTLLQSAGFELRKWSSNSKEFLSKIPIEDQETHFPLNLNEEYNVKTLGLFWHPELDVFQFKINMNPVPEIITKRSILSEIAKLFDPSGWLAPVTVSAKMIMQALWLTGLGWDDELSENMVHPWLLYRQQLKSLETISINRWLGTTANAKSVDLHCFCDASEQAYAAAVYLRVEDNNGQVSVQLIAARTKVSPLKQISLARLELCGAVLGARLLHRIKMDLQLSEVPLVAWTDSTIVLAWLKGNPQRWATFIANRVSEIQQLVPVSAWNHISGIDNPADCASRGISPTLLIHHPLWWHGPAWLIKNPIDWPKQPVVQQTQQELKKTINIQVNIATSDPAYYNKFSSWTRLIRSTAYCLRFIHNCRSKSTSRYGFLSTAELTCSKHTLLKFVQANQFAVEIMSLTKTNAVPTKSKLLNLNPFLDDKGLLRVGGRLQKSTLAFDSKHPIVMPKNHHVTTLLVNHYHQLTLHGGPQITLTIIRHQYWIMNARNTIRHQLHKCVTCYRQKAIVHTQLMGQLPTNRVTQSRPFLHTGVDYAGPLEIKWNKGRGAKCYKAYIALFVCLAVKCVHLELVTDLTTTGFMAAYQRFTARRGLCSDVYSDCGTNFVGAARTLTKDFNRAKVDHQMAEILANDGCNWHFIPPGSPNFGGLWEAGVKSMKTHLKRAVGNSMLTYEEMSTCLQQIEAVLNSRPLCPLSNDPESLEVLTVGHFLIGDALITPPHPNLLDITTNRLTRWQHVQQKFQGFWKRWHVEYLSNLQQRPKWFQKGRDIKPNDMVLIKDERMPPSKWLLGRVVDTTRGTDQLVRVASIKTKNGLISRSISKLCVLPLEHSS